VVRARCRPQTGGTRLELLSELAPRVARIALLAAELVDLNVDVIVVTGFQTGKKMPAMNVRRSLFVPTRSGPSSIETPGRSSAIRIEPSVGEPLDGEPPGGLAAGRLR
jgi:hypothetical protein